jgi:hypothetical protein
MIGQPEIIVGAKIDHPVRLAFVGDGGAGFRRRSHFRLVKFDRPRACLHPTSKAGRGLQRIAAFARKEVTQAEVGWIFVHKKTAPNDDGRGNMEVGDIALLCERSVSGCASFCCILWRFAATPRRPANFHSGPQS